MENVNKRDGILFLSLNFDMIPWNSIQEGSPDRQSKWELRNNRDKD